MTVILGISALYHDSAAALVRDGEIVAAAQEERFSRRKHDERWPKGAIQYVLDEAGIERSQVDAIVFYEKPFIKLDRILETLLAMAPGGLGQYFRAISLWSRDRLQIRRTMRDEMGPGYKGKFLFTEHHRSHAASAFYPSPFEESAILTIDGVGEWATTTLARGSGSQIEILEEIHFPHSIGMLYSAFTYFCGFRVNSGEYKLMGLAPFGEPVYADLIRDKLITVAADGSFKLNMRYFHFTRGLTMTGKAFEELFGGPPRKSETPITKREMDMAASVQVVTEEIMLKLARRACERAGSKNLCMAGGVALNCVGNGEILRSGIVDGFWIQPAAGDAGGSLGAALDVWYNFYAKPRAVTPGDAMHG